MSTAFLAGPEPKIHRVDPEYGSTLRLLQGFSVKLLGQPCEFYLRAGARARSAGGSAGQHLARAPGRLRRGARGGRRSGHARARRCAARAPRHLGRARSATVLAPRGVGVDVGIGGVA